MRSDTSLPTDFFTLIGRVSFGPRDIDLIRLIAVNERRMLRKNGGGAFIQTCVPASGKSEDILEINGVVFPVESTSPFFRQELEHVPKCHTILYSPVHLSGSRMRSGVSISGCSR